jgi:hypothetical protein
MNLLESFERMRGGWERGAWMQSEGEQVLDGMSVD